MARWILLTVVIATLGAAATEPATTQPATSTSIHQLLWGRRDRGGNSFPNMVDPPLWLETRYLLEGESNTHMLALLDSLLSADLAKTMPDTRTRALLQHELWQVFDWTTLDEFDGPAREALRKRLAPAIARLALTKREIEALPESADWDADGSPPKIVDEKSGWISVGLDTIGVAQAHMKELGGRSVFGVYLYHPDGTKAAEAYLKQLADAPFPAAKGPGTTEPDSPGFFAPNTTTPEFPAGTKLALLRRMVLIDTEGKMICSPIVESVQLRTFWKIEAKRKPENVREEEFVFDRQQYLAGKKAMHLTGNEGREPPIFLAQPMDWFESREHNMGDYRPPELTMHSCIGCHRDAGILSMNSFTRALSKGPGGNPQLHPVAFQYQATLTENWKHDQASWGMLRGYWEAGGK